MTVLLRSADGLTKLMDITSQHNRFNIKLPINLKNEDVMRRTDSITFEERVYACTGEKILVYEETR